MPNNAPSTFIPHDASTGSVIRPRRPGGSGIADLALLFSILAFVAAAALGVGVFLYQQYLTTTANSKLAQLKRAEAQFQPELVDQLQRLDERLQAAQTILSQHTAPSAFFGVLDQVTAKTIQFTALNLTVQDKASIEMDGVGKSVNSIAFQADLLSKSGAYQSPIFSALSRQRDGVHFHLTADIVPAVLNYEQLTGGGPSIQQAPSVSPQPAASSSPFGGAPPTPQQ